MTVSIECMMIATVLLASYSVHAQVFSCGIDSLQCYSPFSDIHVFPTSTTITLNYTDLSDSMSNSSRDYGKFECATRPDVMPLWIINGVSATSVKMTPGFENVSYLLFPLTENHTLTLLYVPGSVETNNSIIRCAAVLDLQVVAYSDPVNFTVFCKHIITLRQSMTNSLCSVYRTWCI